MASLPQFKIPWVVRRLSSIAPSGCRCVSPIPIMKLRKLAASTNHATNRHSFQQRPTDRLSVKKEQIVRVNCQPERVLRVSSPSVTQSKTILLSFELTEPQSRLA